mgnify:CR=1 FL=1
MAWITPRDWTALELVTAAYMDQISNDLSELWKGTTAGDTQYYTSSTAQSRLAIGTPYQHLQVNAAGTAPTWGNHQFCTVYKSSTQNFSSGSAADITWNAEVSDVGAWHDTSSNTARITPGIAGLYIPFVSIYWVKDAGGDGTIFHMTAKVQKNTSTQTANECVFPGTKDANTKMFTFGGIPVSLGASDYLKVNFSQDSGGTGTLYGTDEKFSSFSVVRLT